MANNRLWLVHRPTGKSVFLGKRMAWGWYGAPEDIGAQLKALYDAIEHSDTNQDDFLLAMEDADDAPSCTDNFIYEDHRPKLN